MEELQYNLCVIVKFLPTRSEASGSDVCPKNRTDIAFTPSYTRLACMTTAYPHECGVKSFNKMSVALNLVNKGYYHCISLPFLRGLPVITVILMMYAYFFIMPAF